MSSDVTMCEHCKAFVAKCEAPYGEGAVSLCWLCAHDVVFHNAELGVLSDTPCGCKRSEVYPEHVIENLDRALDAASRYRVRPEFMGRDSERRMERVARVTLHRTGEHPAQS